MSLDAALRKVKEFHDAFGLPVFTSPGDPGAERTNLRADLIEEESGEAVEAMINSWNESFVDDALSTIAKELADVIIVALGAALELGIPLSEVFDEVMLSNMSKLQSDGKPLYREDGKVMKGPNYKPPDILKIINKHILLGNVAERQKSIYEVI